MTGEKIILMLGAIIFALVVLSYLQPRYQVIPLDKPGAIRIDTRTGEVSLCTPRGCKPVRENDGS